MGTRLSNKNEQDLVFSFCFLVVVIEVVPSHNMGPQLRIPIRHYIPNNVYNIAIVNQNAEGLIYMLKIVEDSKYFLLLCL